jgi:hypothetical protein
MWDMIAALVLVGAIILETLLVFFLLRPMFRRRPRAPYVNECGQAVCQINPTELTTWLDEHREYEIVSISNAGAYIVIVYK